MGQLRHFISLYPHQKQEKRKIQDKHVAYYLNDTLAIENASVERHQRRIIKETDIEELKIVIQKHLPETKWY